MVRVWQSYSEAVSLPSGKSFSRFPGSLMTTHELSFCQARAVSSSKDKIEHRGLGGDPVNYPKWGGVLGVSERISLILLGTQWHFVWASGRLCVMPSVERDRTFQLARLGVVCAIKERVSVSCDSQQHLSSPIFVFYHMFLLIIAIDHSYWVEFTMFPASVVVLDWLFVNACEINREAIIHRDFLWRQKCLWFISRLAGIRMVSRQSAIVIVLY